MNDAQSNWPAVRILDLLRLGFFFGLGLSVAAWAAYAAAYVLWPKQSCSDSSSSRTQSTRSNEPSGARSLEIGGVEEHKSANQLYFTGVVKNAGPVPVNSGQIQVDMFKGGKFVDQYSNYFPGSLAPGESRNFKVSCDCRDMTPAEHDSFKVQVVGGF